MARDRTEVEFLRPYLVQHRGCTEREFDRLVQQWEAGAEPAFLRYLVSVQVIEPSLARTVEVVRKGYAAIDLAPLFGRNRSAGAAAAPLSAREPAASAEPEPEPVAAAAFASPRAIAPAVAPAATPTPQPAPIQQPAQVPQRAQVPQLAPIQQPALIQQPAPIRQPAPIQQPAPTLQPAPVSQLVSKAVPESTPAKKAAPADVPTSAEESASWPANLLAEKPSPAAPSPINVADPSSPPRPRASRVRGSGVRGVTTHDAAPPADRAELAQLSDQTKIGRFTLQEKLGEGATAVIFRAFHQMLGIPVAVKIFHARLTDDRFDPRALAEAKLLARVDHPNIVRVLDADVFEGRPYIVFEYMRAPNLQTTVSQQGRQSASQVAQLGLKIADALRAAHEQGLIHRDVKPENILLRSDGQLKLTDFGFATLNAADGSSASEQIIGTPNYMSPEQAADPARVDLRSDMYSLGATLYFAATGRPPFERPTPLETIQAQLNDFPIAIHTANLDFNLVLSQIIMRLLAKRPAERYATWEDVQQELRDVLLAADPQAMSGIVSGASSSSRLHVSTLPSARTGPGRSARKGSRQTFPSERNKLTAASFTSAPHAVTAPSASTSEESSVRPRRLPLAILFYLAAVIGLVIYVIARLALRSS